jgi:subtilisin family serine protease
MSTEKEYVVVVNRGVDLTLFVAELTSDIVSGPIPNRSVNIANPRLGSNRMTHWMLTDDEATTLMNDPRVLSVEIPVDQRTDISIGLRATQTADFDKPTILESDKVNWGLRRCIEETNIYSDGDSASTSYPYALDGTGVDIVIQDSGLQVDHPEFITGAIVDAEYNNGAIIDLVGNGSDFFKREVTVNGARIVAAGTVGGQTAVPDAFIEKVARMFELFTNPASTGINEAAQRTLIKTLSGDTGTYHAGFPTLQRVARGAGGDYTPNFLTDDGIASWNLSPLFDSHMANDMVWYLNSTGDGYGTGDIDAQEVIEHVFHTLHMHGLDALTLKLYPDLSTDWASSDLYAAMAQAYDGGFWDSSGYGGAAWKISAEQFPVAAKEYLYLLNFCMFEYTDLWDGGSLSPEWVDSMRTQTGIQSNNPLGYALYNTHIAPVISKPSLDTIRNIFQDGNTPAQDNPALSGSSGYVSDLLASESRVRQVDWYAVSGVAGTQPANHYRDFDGHGTHCAGIAAGKTYGWAKGAHVYSQKLAGLEGPGDTGTGISITDAFDTIRLWHAAKTNGRPTIVNMSWGYFSEVSGDPTGGTYRGSAYSWSDYATNLEAWTAVGVVPPVGAARYYPFRVASVDAEVDDMIDAGIHVCIAAGNDYFKGDVPGGADYNNTVVYGGASYFYHRGSSPHSDQAIIVGNSDTTTQQSGADYLDKVSTTTSRGPRLTCFAPGQNIVSTCSITSIYSTIPYPADTNYRIAMINGTSMASPQVAGVIAQYLQSRPELSPADIKTNISNDAKSVMFTTGVDNDYSTFGTSLLGSPNKLLYSKYGIQPTTTTGSFSITGSLSITSS